MEGQLSKEDYMELLKQEIDVASTQELISKITEKCFKKCIGKPGTSLGSSDQKCLAMCMDRYLDSYNVVSKAYGLRIQRERNRM